MNITLPLPTTVANQYQLILNMWINAREERVVAYKKQVGKEFRRSWWNEIFHKGSTDEELFNKQAGMEHRYHLAWVIRDKEPINELTELLSANKLARDIGVPSSYTIPANLVDALNGELK